jgi:hypothetical protein
MSDKALTSALLGSTDIPSYASQGKLLCTGGTIKFTFAQVVKNITLFIRRLLPYAKP